jgi:two-component system chemotaxis response regulator CheB
VSKSGAVAKSDSRIESSTGSAPVTGEVKQQYVPPGGRRLYAEKEVKLRPVNRILPFKVLGIGVSTGGPNAMSEVFSNLRSALPVPIFITQHMPPVFTKMFAERLQSSSGLKVYEAVDDQPVLPGEVYVAPGGYHMVVVDNGGKLYIKLNQEPPENSCRPSVDVMFRSLVKIYGSGVLGFILTGMGSDGLHGCQEIVNAGGQIFVQDEETSAVWGMPGAVATAGLASGMFPLNSIAIEIKKRFGVS